MRIIINQQGFRTLLKCARESSTCEVVNLCVQMWLEHTIRTYQNLHKSSSPTEQDHTATSLICMEAAQHRSCTHSNRVCLGGRYKPANAMVWFISANAGCIRSFKYFGRLWHAGRIGACRAARAQSRSLGFTSSSVSRQAEVLQWAHRWRWRRCRGQPYTHQGTCSTSSHWSWCWPQFPRPFPAKGMCRTSSTETLAIDA